MLVVDDFSNADELRQIVKDWPSEGWRVHSHANSGNKRSIASLADMPSAARKCILQLNGQSMIDFLSKRFNRKIIPDPWILMKGKLFGGGLHDIGTDGFLNSHVDYNFHPAGVYRRLNLLLYLNDWKPGDGGELEINGQKIEPVFNRCVVFETTEDSWHGHPNPWNGKDTRKSIAIYYYSGEGEAVKPHSTIYVPR